MHNQQDDENKEKKEILNQALEKDIDTSHIKPNQTKCKFDIPCLALILGMSGSGKTSYILNMFIDDPRDKKHKSLIYINSDMAPLDKMIVKFAEKNKNVLIITTDNLNMNLVKQILEIVKSYNNNPKDPVYTYIVIDNLVFDISIDVLKFLIMSRHYHVMVFALIHVISNTSANALSGLRDLSTHYIIMRWNETEKLKKLLSKENIDDFIKNVNKNKNKHIKLIFDKYAQTKHYE